MTRIPEEFWGIVLIQPWVRWRLPQSEYYGYSRLVTTVPGVRSTVKCRFLEVARIMLASRNYAHIYKVTTYMPWFDNNMPSTSYLPRGFIGKHQFNLTGTQTPTPGQEGWLEGRPFSEEKKRLLAGHQKRSLLEAIKHTIWRLRSYCRALGTTGMSRREQRATMDGAIP